MPIPKKPQTDGSSTFEPDQFFETWAKEDFTLPIDNDFRKFIIKAFGLRVRDTYAYKATAEVTLEQAQSHVQAGGINGLHAWYRDGEGKPVSRYIHDVGLKWRDRPLMSRI